MRAAVCSPRVETLRIVEHPRANRPVVRDSAVRIDDTSFRQRAVLAATVCFADVAKGSCDNDATLVTCIPPYHLADIGLRWRPFGSSYRAL